jgi:hypothetical protein
MAYNSTYDLLGKKVSDTYPSLLQSGSDGVFYDGRGNSVTINATIPDIYVLTSSFNNFTSSYNTGSFTGSFTGSLLGTASYALNGGVTQITAGTGVIISPPTGLGNVTVTSLAPSYNTATGSYGSFFSTGSQTAVLAAEIYSMSISTTDISNGVYISGSGDPYNTFVKFNNAGTYNIQFSAQFSNSGNNPSDVIIWLRKNDVSSVNDLADSSGICTVPAKKGTVPGQLIASWNYLINVVAGDFIQLLWHTADANVITLETIAAGTNPTHPRTPALILTAQRVDTFLSNTGSFSGSFTGEFTGSLLGTGSWAVSASQAVTSSYSNTSQTTSTITVNSFGSNVESYLLMSNVVALPGVAIGGDADLRYNASTNRLSVGSISATSLTGSLQGTASWADNATTASYILNAVSSSFASTASFAPNYLLVSSTSSMLAPYVLSSQTSSFVTNSQTGSFITTASVSLNTITFTKANGTTFPITVNTGSGGGSGAGFPFSGSAVITGSLFISGSAGLTITGSGILTAGAVGGDEGGEILLGKAITNTTLTGSGVTIDVYQNRLRIFEQGGSNRGGYFDITDLAAGVGTNLSTAEVTLNRQAASYVLALTDIGKLVEMNVGTANTLTVPSSSTANFPIGAKIDIAQYGAGQTTVTTGSVNVSLRSAGNATKLAAQYAGATVVKIATDEWYLFGNITV